MCNRTILLILLALVFSATLLAGAGYAQKKTIILVRHAEKADATSVDPELSPDGKLRADRLMKIVKRYRPGAIYSTDFRRTRDTAAPMAKKRGLAVQTYDAKKPEELIDQIMKSKTKRFMIVGHSNTIPGLANLLGKKDLFRNLDDHEYGAIWIVRIKDGKVGNTEIIPY